MVVASASANDADAPDVEFLDPQVREREREREKSSSLLFKLLFL